LWDSRIIRREIHYRDRLGSLVLPMPALRGRYQSENAALAVAMLRQQDRLKVPDKALAQGIADADWPARLQKLRPGPLTKLVPAGSELWLDGGHNGAAARLVADYARRSLTGDLPFALLFASLSTKDPRAMLRPFREAAAAVHTLPIPNHDHRPPEALAELARALGFQSSSNASIEQALGRIEEPSRVLIFGSLYLAGEVLKANRQIPD
jgi:dihydrofolate synthase/folylpolyglutamate synthase